MPWPRRVFAVRPWTCRRCGATLRRHTPAAWAAVVIVCCFGLASIAIVGFAEYSTRALLYLAILVGGLPMVILTLLERAVVVEASRSHCPCGYDLTGNTTGICPECGKAARM